MIDLNDIAPAATVPAFVLDLNDVAPPSSGRYDLEELSRRLSEQAGSWAPQLFPNGRQEGGELRLANIKGERPRKTGSCVIPLTGTYAGCFHDFDTGESGGPLKTLEHATGLSGRALFDYAAGLVGLAAPKAQPARGAAKARKEEDTAREIAFILSRCKPLAGKPRRSRRDLINTVRGTFISPAQNWQPTDYPPVCVAAYKTADGGEEVAENLDLPYTRSPYMAQRIARIALEMCRRELTVQLPANLAGLRVVAGETVTLTLSRFGLTQVPMVVAQWQLTEELGVNLTLHREDPDIYAFALGDLVTMPAQAPLSLPGNQDIPPAVPTGLAASLSGADVRLTWSAVAEPDFSHFEVYEGAAGSTPEQADRLGEPYASTWFRDGLPGGAARNYWVRSVDRHGNRSGFAGPVAVNVSTSAGAVLVLE